MTEHLTPSEFAKLAEAQVGKPYVLGAEVSLTDPSPAKFDCSELVQWLYAQSGNKITDGAWLQYAATKAVTGTPRAGDLVFLRNNPDRFNGIGHVAVLTRIRDDGDWEIIEARGRAYGVVKTTLAYWKKRAHYAGLRRLEGFELAAEPVPVTPPPAVLPPTVKLGSKGAHVIRLQKALKAFGFRIVVDGDFGAKTQRAVKAFQKVKNLTIDGIVGRQSWKALLA